MERLSLVLCIVLACVAPAMAADWYQVPASGHWDSLSAGDGTNMDDYTRYQTVTPDSQVEQDWLTNTYSAPYDTFADAPYYESTASASDVFPTNPADINVRMNMITQNGYLTTDIDWNSLTVADSYWPADYSVYGDGYTNQNVYQGLANACTVHISTFNVGQSDFGTTKVAANHGIWNVRNDHPDTGTTVLTIDDLHVLNTDTTVTSYANQGVSNYTISTAANGLSQNKVEVYQFHIIEEIIKDFFSEDDCNK